MYSSIANFSEPTGAIFVGNPQFYANHIKLLNSKEKPQLRNVKTVQSWV